MVELLACGSLLREQQQLALCFPLLLVASEKQLIAGLRQLPIVAAVQP